ncbi:hypothetical protein D3C86_369340 [compost metagenome]
MASRLVTLPVNPLVNTALDIPKLWHVLGGYKGNCKSLLSGTACPANPVNVAFMILGNIIVIDMGYPFNIDPPGSHIRSNKELQLRIPEGPHHLFTLRLGKISV